MVEWYVHTYLAMNYMELSYTYDPLMIFWIIVPYLGSNITVFTSCSYNFNKFTSKGLAIYSTIYNNSS